MYVFNLRNFLKLLIGVYVKASWQNIQKGNQVGAFALVNAQKQAKPMVLNWRQFCPTRQNWTMSGDIFIVMAGGGNATGIYWEEARDSTKHPTMHRTAFPLLQ